MRPGRRAGLKTLSACALGCALLLSSCASNLESTARVIRADILGQLQVGSGRGQVEDFLKRKGWLNYHWEAGDQRKIVVEIVEPKEIVIYLYFDENEKYLRSEVDTIYPGL